MATLNNSLRDVIVKLPEFKTLDIYMPLKFTGNTFQTNLNIYHQLKSRLGSAKDLKVFFLEFWTNSPYL